MVTTAVVAETRTVLEDISWQTFKVMLAEIFHNLVRREIEKR